MGLASERDRACKAISIAFSKSWASMLLEASSKSAGTASSELLILEEDEQDETHPQSAKPARKEVKSMLIFISICKRQIY